MGRQPFGRDLQERKGAGGDRRLSPGDMHRGRVRLDFITVRQVRLDARQAVVLFVLVIQRIEARQFVRPDQQVVVRADRYGAGVARGVLDDEPGKGDGALRPLAQPVRRNAFRLKRNARDFARWDALRQANVDQRFALRRIVTLDRQRLAVGRGDLRHVPAGRRGEVDGEQLFDLGQQGEPAAHVVALIVQHQQHVGGDLQPWRRLAKAGLQSELGQRGVIGRHRPDARRAGFGAKHGFRQGRGQHAIVHRDQALGFDPLGRQLVFHDQAHDGHLARHVQRRQLRHGPVLEPRGRPRRRDVQHDGFRRRFAKDDLQHALVVDGRHRPARQQRTEHLGRLEALGQRQAEPVGRSVQYVERHGRVQPFVGRRDLVHQDAAGHDDALLAEHAVVQRHDERQLFFG